MAGDMAKSKIKSEVDLTRDTGYNKTMNRGFFLKLTIGILAGFGLLIAGFAFWKPLHVTYYKFQLGSSNQETHAAAVKYLLEADEIEAVKYYYENRYASKDVKERLAVVDELCGFGDKGKQVMYDIFRARCLREMVPIPAGSFMMGSEYGAKDEKPVHEVTLSAFWMDKYEVTNEKYYVFVKCTNHRQPSHWDSGRIPAGLEQHPVVNVSWEDADAYAKWLKMRLPTEAEWEYACRAGSSGEYCFGDNEGELGEYAWFDSNSGGETHPVGTREPNKWRLYDMHGNVWEWCQDWYDEKYYSNSSAVDPKGPGSGTSRVLRCGGWGGVARNCRSAFRNYGGPDLRFGFLGFRVGRSSGP
jgi:formylglycine-generating enzyme required for sulfatase activity